MNLLLIGYGKMGRAVEAEAAARGHAIVTHLGRHEISQLNQQLAAQVDVAIEFTHPESFRGNLTRLLQLGIPTVCGTTGWYSDVANVKQEVESSKGSFLFASNFSVGVQLLFELNRRLATLMNGYPEYDVFVEEQHHRHKADAPSGTAHSLAKDILEHLDRKNSLSGEPLRERAPRPEELSVSFTRAGDIVGEHRVTYRSDIDRITLTHEAYSRRGFALGAVIAAEWLLQHPGFHPFEDMFRE